MYTSLNIIYVTTKKLYQGTTLHLILFCLPPPPPSPLFLSPPFSRILPPTPQTFPLSLSGHSALSQNFGQGGAGYQQRQSQSDL